MSTVPQVHKRSLEIRWFAGAIVLLVAVAMLVSVGIVSAETGITSDYSGNIGDFCVDHYWPGSNCTSNDVVIARLIPIQTIDACTWPGDTTTVKFKAELRSNATERYDIGMFINTIGGSAQTGNMCYHDYLNPIQVSDETPNVTSGIGPYWDLESDPVDSCGDIKSADLFTYYDAPILDLTCVDANADHIIDPVSTCVSWDNNQSGTCSSANDAYPNNKAKCNCEPAVLDPPIFVYDGYDFGDLPDLSLDLDPPYLYFTLLADDGARHAVQHDMDSDGAPDTTGDVAAVWLGAAIDLEDDGQPTQFASGDDVHPSPPGDEDGVEQLSPRWVIGTDGGHIAVTVSTSSGGCSNCQLAFWFDWNGDGVMNDTTEQTVELVTAGVNFIDFDIPDSWTAAELYARFRLYDGPANNLPTGLVLNGEVEDYYFYLTPLAVSIESFTAVSEADHILVSWQTVTELDNLGFNLYRSAGADGVRVRLNDALIPATGGTSGHAYTWEDRMVAAGVAYSYWLEDVDVHGQPTLREMAIATWQPSVARSFYLPLFFGR